jgi:hypothetical protein
MAKEGATRGPKRDKDRNDGSGRTRSKGGGDKGGGSKSGTTHGR